MRKAAPLPNSRVTRPYLALRPQGECQLPELDRACFCAPLGEVSGPLRTAQGWHLVLVEERFGLAGKALFELYREWDGMHWKAKFGWLRTAKVSKWHGAEVVKVRHPGFSALYNEQIHLKWDHHRVAPVGTWTNNVL